MKQNEDHLKGATIVEGYMDTPIFEDEKDLYDRTKIEESVQKAVYLIKQKMLQIWKKLPDNYKERITHIEQKEHLERYQVAAEYLVQELLFRELGKRYKLNEITQFLKGAQSGVMMLTYSHSLIVASPFNREGSRVIEYIRIPSRVQSWGHTSTYPSGTLTTDVALDDRAIIEASLQTSPVQAMLEIPAQQSGQLEKIRQEARDSFHSTVISCGLGVDRKD